MSAISNKRLKVIFSVLASPSRLEILKILAARGGMSYTELKEASGFTPKRESGKFAYHLKKLVQQNLVIQNRQERKYMLAPLGRLVLSLAKQIEEHSLMSSGRLFVRESNQSMEEFDPSKIVQSLVKEAKVPLEMAQNIASEAESRIYKFQITYLTSPLIREIVNSILLEQGLVDYWKRLSRIGMPVYDLEQLMDEVGKDGLGTEELVYRAASKLFSDYLTRANISQDVIDAHFNGDIHLPYAESWLLKPDVIVLDYSKLADLPFGEKYKGPEGLMKLVYGLSREAVREVYVYNVSIDSTGGNPFLMFHNLLPNYTRAPILTLESGQEMIDQYEKYYLSVKDQRVYLAVRGKASARAPIFINNDNSTVTGLRIYGERHVSLGIEIASVNLPRIAEDVQGEESYFNVRLLLLKDVLQQALEHRLQSVSSRISLGQLPFLRSIMLKNPRDYMEHAFNITGLRDAMVRLNIGDSDVEKEEQGIAATFQDRAGMPVALISDDGASRLAALDYQRMGKRAPGISYSQGIVVDSHDTGIKGLYSAFKGGVKVVSYAGPLDLGVSYLLGVKEVVCSACGWPNPEWAERCRNCGSLLRKS